MHTHAGLGSRIAIKSLTLSRRMFEYPYQERRGCRMQRLRRVRCVSPVAPISIEVLERERSMQIVRRDAMPRFRMIVGAFLAVLSFLAQPAFAGVAGSAVPTMPACPVNVGDALTVPLPFGPTPSVILSNAADGANLVDWIGVTAIHFTPSCQSGAGNCAAGSEDPGVFSISGTGTGAALSSCEGVTFTLTNINSATGQLQIDPQNTTLSVAIPDGTTTSITVGSAAGFSTTVNYLIQIDSEQMLVTGGKGTTTWIVTRGMNGTAAVDPTVGATVTQLTTLGPRNGLSGPFVCQVYFTGSVVKRPTKDSSGSPGQQTTSLASATFSGNGAFGSQSSQSTTTVTGPSLVVTKNPVGGTVNGGQTATFTIVVTNNGDGAATNVLISDPLPNVAGLTWVLAETGVDVP